MPDLINIDVKEANDKLILINKYFMLIIVICFGSAIMYLYFQVNTLNKQIFEYITHDSKENAKAIEGNTLIIQENTNTLNRLNNYFLQHSK